MRLLAVFFLLLLTASSTFGQEVQRLDVTEKGLVAHVFKPATKGPHPAVMLLGGSGGGIGWQDQMADILARRGFVAMSVAYFGMEGLPPELERIPQEYFETALQWLLRQSYVDARRVGVGGVSKGGEIALLLASRRPEFRAVATFVASGVVFQSIAKGFPKTSSWSHQGRDIPFVAYGSVANPSSTAEFYEAGLRQTNALEQATIPVERINGPILLMSGKADNLWPSSMLSEMVMTRLREKKFKHPYEHIAYPDAGHLISSIRTDDVTRRGGTLAGNRTAQEDGQQRFINFFERYLRLGKR